MNIAIYGRKITKQNASFFKHVFATVEQFGWKPILEEKFKDLYVKKTGLGEDYPAFQSHHDLKSGVDLAISLGGDGSFIKTVSYVRDSGVPVLGVHKGRMGFLANVNAENLERAFEQIKNREFEFQERSMLRISTQQNLFGEDNLALNEVTLHKKDAASMITVHASLEDKYLNSYWADGLIVSTPTGSTAYNLSCGGPIITPGCQVHCLTPIAPHNLNMRPMVVPDKFPIRLSVEGRERKYLISLDSNSKSISQGEEIIITKANFMINVVKFLDQNFLDTIRNKMSWGYDIRN
ncbi:MAG: NAD kinase [Bacteroidetes bacterium]|nr:MAG: NAD kinase [Bacteroidota bacterium]